MTSATVPVVELTQARVARGERVLLDVPALAVRRGEILVVIGPNGAGKSTLLRVLGLLEEPAGGSVRFQGERGGAQRRPRRAPPDGERVPGAAARRHDRGGQRRPWACAFAACPPPSAAPRVARWLERLGVGRPGAASGAHAVGRRGAAGGAGARPRARARDSAPRRALLGARPAVARGAHRGPRRHPARRIASPPCSSPTIAGEALALGDRVGVMMDGRLLQLDSPAQVFRAPVSEAVARFVGVETILDCRVAEFDGRDRGAGGGRPADRGGAAGGAGRDGAPLPPSRGRDAARGRARATAARAPATVWPAACSASCRAGRISASAWTAASSSPRSSRIDRRSRCAWPRA